LTDKVFWENTGFFVSGMHYAYNSRGLNSGIGFVEMSFFFRYYSVSKGELQQWKERHQNSSSICAGKAAARPNTPPCRQGED